MLLTGVNRAKHLSRKYQQVRHIHNSVYYNKNDIKNVLVFGARSSAVDLSESLKLHGDDYQAAGIKIWYMPDLGATYPSPLLSNIFKNFKFGQGPYGVPMQYRRLLTEVIGHEALALKSLVQADQALLTDVWQHPVVQGIDPQEVQTIYQEDGVTKLVGDDGVVVHEIHGPVEINVGLQEFNIPPEIQNFDFSQKTIHNMTDTFELDEQIHSKKTIIIGTGLSVPFFYESQKNAGTLHVIGRMPRDESGKVIPHDPSKTKHSYGGNPRNIETVEAINDAIEKGEIVEHYNEDIEIIEVAPGNYQIKDKVTGDIIAEDIEVIINATGYRENNQLVENLDSTAYIRTAQRNLPMRNHDSNYSENLVSPMDIPPGAVMARRAQNNYLYKNMGEIELACHNKYEITQLILHENLPDGVALTHDQSDALLREVYAQMEANQISSPGDVEPDALATWADKNGFTSDQVGQILQKLEDATQMQQHIAATVKTNDIFREAYNHMVENKIQDPASIPQDVLQQWSERNKLDLDQVQTVMERLANSPEMVTLTTAIASQDEVGIKAVEERMNRRDHEALEPSTLKAAVLSTWENDNVSSAQFDSTLKAICVDNTKTFDLRSSGAERVIESDTGQNKPVEIMQQHSQKFKAIIESQDKQQESSKTKVLDLDSDSPKLNN